MFKHWKIIGFINDYAHLTSPTMEKNDPEVFKDFKDRKALRKELKELENTIGKGWISWTLTSRPHIIRLFTKIGATPFLISLDTDEKGHIIWFKRDLRR